MSSAHADAADVMFEASRPMPVAEETQAPPGFTEFCAHYVGDCPAPVTKPVAEALTSTRAAELERVNRRVNASVESTTDRHAFGVDDLWRYPADKGDCEDFVLEKRKLLLLAGWPRQALLITVVRAPRGAGHAVLTVVTDRGDFILDNNTDRILPWFRTRYAYVKRQAQTKETAWVRIPG